MKKIKRVFLIVLDSFGIGELPDASKWGDEGSHTLRTCYSSGKLNVPAMSSLGLFNIDGIGCGKPETDPIGAYCKIAELSAGKDTTVGHWEIAGLVSEKPFPVYPKGFPSEIINEFEKETGRKVLCNMPYSGTAVIADYGQQHEKTGDLIIYTSADSVFQIAAHESIVSTQELYSYCKIARRILQGENAVARVIARPFTGEYPNYIRTPRRHDFSFAPTGTTLIDELVQADLNVVPIGKIFDIFAGKSLKEAMPTSGNDDGMRLTSEWLNKDFHGLCFTNLVDFDMLYGHRNDVDGYTQALNRFDEWLSSFMKGMRRDDVLFITADHGCDPGTESTDHSREYVPLLVYGEQVARGNFGVRNSFADIGKTVASVLGVDAHISGETINILE